MFATHDVFSCGGHNLIDKSVDFRKRIACIGFVRFRTPKLSKMLIYVCPIELSESLEVVYSLDLGSLRSLVSLSEVD